MDDEHDDWDRLPIDPDVELPDPAERALGRPSGDRRSADGPGEASTRPARDPKVVVAIALGAMPGAAARYGLSRLLPTPAGSFPWATFWTNVTGAFVLGVLLVLLLERFPPTRYARAFAGTGFLGAYTTFSTFSVEADVLVKDGHAATAGTYVVASLVVGLAAAWAAVVGTGLVWPRTAAPAAPRPGRR